MSLEERRLAAIRISQRMGEELAEEHPKIADEYRSGKYIRQIARRYLSEKGIKTQEMRISIVQHAISRLINPEEREELALDHWSASGSDSVRLERKRKTGLFSLTERALKDISRKGNEAQSIRTYSDIKKTMRHHTLKLQKSTKRFLRVLKVL